MTSATEQKHLSAFAIESFGNGFAVEIRRNSDGATAFLQGDDASKFCEALDQTPKNSPTISPRSTSSEATHFS